MSRDEVLERLQFTRSRFDQRVAAIPRERFDVVPEGRTHTPKQVVAHVTAYEDLVVQRLRAARSGSTTTLFRDRVGWEEFNDQVWAQSAEADPDKVLALSDRTFRELIREISLLYDPELISRTGVTEHIDSAWLQGRTLAEVIAVDCFDHYPMHYEELDEAAR